MRSYEKFIKAKPSNPCPICGVGAWCGFNSYLASCMRIKEGSFKEVTMSNGQIAYLHWLDPGMVNLPAPTRDGLIIAEQTAPVEVRDRVYREFLRLLSLNARHKDDLLRRGLSEKDIEEKCFKSVPEAVPVGNKPWKICRRLIESGYSLTGIPGYYKAYGPYGGTYWTFDRQPGYFIPVLDNKGRIQALQRRMDDPNRGGKYKLFSGHKHQGGCTCGTPAHIARPENLRDQRLWITEGPLKADIASKYLGATLVGALSATTWKPVLDAVLELGAKEIVMAYDMDAATNPIVARSEKALKCELLKHGLKVQRAVWENGKGIDDVLVAMHKSKTLNSAGRF
ncbi:MAG: topoisomerase [Peptococcaceae bacterium BRH_c8a]|nr:MAG: topoisomerase [Peptococcaceae bacterium BRH_c8a]